MPTYSDLQPDMHDAESLARSAGILRRTDLPGGRVVYFRSARAPLHALDADELWTALGLTWERTAGLHRDLLASLDGTFHAVRFELGRVPLVLFHHDGSVTLADLAGGTAATYHAQPAPRYFRRLRSGCWRNEKRTDALTWLRDNVLDPLADIYAIARSIR